jgi:hypothetical protein
MTEHDKSSTLSEICDKADWARLLHKSVRTIDRLYRAPGPASW